MPVCRWIKMVDKHEFSPLVKGQNQLLLLGHFQIHSFLQTEIFIVTIIFLRWTLYFIFKLKGAFQACNSEPLIVTCFSWKIYSIVSSICTVDFAIMFMYKWYGTFSNVWMFHQSFKRWVTSLFSCINMILFLMLLL